MIERVVVIGATGTLARPVIRRMVNEGLYVRAFVRNLQKGESLLPGGVELFEGHLQDLDSIARGLHGANGITLEYPPIRHMLNLESVYTYEGTNEVHSMIIGRGLTGLDAF